MEIWKSIPSTLFHYEASSFGRIRRVKPSKGTLPGKILKPQLARNGYLQLVLKINTKSKTSMVARLVCEAFNGEPPQGFDVNHKDFNRLNNTPENLEWLSRRDNIRYTLNSGRRDGLTFSEETKKKISEAQKKRFREKPESFPVGDNRSNTKYSNELILRAIQMKINQPSKPISEIAKELGISYNVAYGCITNRKRKYLNLGPSVGSGDISKGSEDLVLASVNTPSFSHNL